jgi:hypothetical protein
MRDEPGEYVPLHEVGERLGDNAVEAKALQLLGSPRVNEEFLFVDVGDVLADHHHQCLHPSAPLSPQVKAKEQLLSRHAPASRPAAISASGYRGSHVGG